MAIPLLPNARVSSFDASRSSSGTSAGSISTIVVSAPRSRKYEANSQPTAPPPTTMTLRGLNVPVTMSSLLTMIWPSVSSPGILRTLEPVAITMSRAIRRRVSPVGAPASSKICTSTVVSSMNVARPAMSSTPFFLKSDLRPACMRLTMRSRRAATVPVLTPVAGLISMPKSAALPILARRSPVSSIALAGIQPQWRQVPPTFACSMSVTVRPSCAARNAAA